MALSVSDLMVTEPPPVRLEADGTLRVGGTRVTLDVVLGAYKRGVSAEQIARDYDTLSLADVYAALAYYLRHTDALDAYLSDRETEADAFQREIETEFPPDGLKARLLTRLNTTSS